MTSYLVEQSHSLVSKLADQSHTQFSFIVSEGVTAKHGFMAS
jgi:hypothetical protein